MFLRQMDDLCMLQGVLHVLLCVIFMPVIGQVVNSRWCAASHVLLSACCLRSDMCCLQSDVLQLLY